MKNVSKNTNTNVTVNSVENKEEITMSKKEIIEVARNIAVEIAKDLYGMDLDARLAGVGEALATWEPEKVTKTFVYFAMDDPWSDGEIGNDLEVRVRRSNMEVQYRLYHFFCDEPEDNGWTTWSTWIPLSDDDYVIDIPADKCLSLNDVVASDEEIAEDFKADMIDAAIDAAKASIAVGDLDAATIVAENVAKDIYGDAYEWYCLASVEENENEIEFSFEPFDDLVDNDGYCYEDCEWCVEIRVRKEDLNVKFRNIYLWLDDYGYVDETEASEWSEWLTWKPKEEKDVVSVGDLPITKDNAPDIEEHVEKGGDDMKTRNRRLLLNLLCYRWVAESRLFYKSNKYKEEGGDFYFIASRKRQLGVTCKALKDLGWAANKVTLDRVAEILREEGIKVSDTRDVYIPTPMWEKLVKGKAFLDSKKGNKDIVAYLKEVI